MKGIPEGDLSPGSMQFSPLELLGAIAPSSSTGMLRLTVAALRPFSRNFLVGMPTPHNRDILGPLALDPAVAESLAVVSLI